MTLREALRSAASHLESNAVPSPRLSAEVLLCHCLSVQKEYLYTHDERELTSDEVQALKAVIKQRLAGVPIQYIVGKQEFFGRSFAVNPSVLIPRPETELLVERVIEAKPSAGSRIIDVGTGSGCIGISLALELRSPQITLSDLSFEALQTARLNARNLKAKVELLCMNLLDAVSGPFDFILSNPPYVSPEETSHLQREIRENEPHIALFADEEGLGVYRRLIPAAHHCLRIGGHLFLEIGFALEEPVSELLREGWEKLPTITDLQGIPRIVSARRVS